MVRHPSVMNPIDTSALVNAVQWSEEGSYVREIVSRGKLPQVAKVIKGQYLGIGVPSLANPGLSSTLFLLSGGKTLRVSAQCVKFKEGRRVVPVGPKLAIPESYDGYFEILSEDGRAVKCMESIAELAKRFPDSCLVRETMKAYVSKSDDVDTITEKSRAVLAGETLVLVGEVIGSKNGKTQHRFLRCFDQGGQNIYLPYDAKGKFSAIAKEDNISGVHSIKNLLNKRLPLMVRLVHGHPPAGAKSVQFLPELRLFASFTEEALAVLPVGKESPLVLIPPSAHLKLILARNSETIQKAKGFVGLCEKSNLLLQELSERIHVYDTAISSKNRVKDPRFCYLPIQSKPRQKHCHIHPHRNNQQPKNPSDNSLVEKKTVKGTPDEYDEIDQIYDYVRGFAPLPKHIKTSLSPQEHDVITSRQPVSPKALESKPNPPPIETIPMRKNDRHGTEQLAPSVHPALISAALEKAERKVDKKAKEEDHHKNGLTHTPAKVDKKAKEEDHHKNGLTHTPAKQLTSILSPLSTAAAPDAKLTNKLFIKASQKKPSKTRMFRRKSMSPVNETVVDHVNNPVLTSFATNQLITPPKPAPTLNLSLPSLFKVRYKSLTNLAVDFDTLDSSMSGGKGSGESCGSVLLKPNPVEKKTKKLPRPKSLTNLVWDGRGNTCNLHSSPLSGGASRGLLDAEKKLRLEPGVYMHGRDAPALLAATSRLLSSQKKIGTLYI